MEPLPQFVDEVLQEWDTIAFFAYSNFELSGRGLVGMTDGADGTEMFYAPQEHLIGFGVGPKERKLVEDYDPEFEFLVKFDAVGGTRTVRIRTPENGRHPRRVWVFEMLARSSEAPGEVPEIPLG
jgi:hypothetical protein